jgi:hypothetical protein
VPRLYELENLENTGVRKRCETSMIVSPLGCGF